MSAAGGTGKVKWCYNLENPQTPKNTVNTAVLALGSNLGNSEHTLEQAVAELAAAGVHPVRASGLYVTDAVGGPANQPPYVNAVIEVCTGLDPYRLLQACHAVEAAHKRVRTVRWGPRTLDIDIITYNTLTSRDERLILPHPRAHERAFVLVPWAQANPQAVLPVWVASGWVERPVAELARQVSAADTAAGVNAVKLLRPMNCTVGGAFRG